MHFRKVGASLGSSDFRIRDQSIRHFETDIALRFLGAAADVGSQDDIFEASEFGLKGIFAGVGLVRKDIHRGAGQVAALQCPLQRDHIHDGPPAEVEQIAPLGHPLQLFAADHFSGQRCIGNVKRYEVRNPEQFFQTADLPRIPERKFFDNVMKNNPHAERFGQQPDLRPDVAVADDADCLAPHFHAALGRFFPAAAMQLHRPLRGPPRQHDHFGDCQLRHAARIAERRIKDGHASSRRRLHIHLIRADTEAAHSDQVGRRIQHAFGNVRLRSNPKDVHIGQSLYQLVLGKRAGVFLDLSKIARAKCLLRDGMNIFQKEHINRTSGRRHFR